MQQWFDYWKKFNRPIVLGEGNPASPWWGIGEALGEEEERNKTPFYRETPAGSLFRAMLDQARVNPSALFITNIYPIRPPMNKIDRLAEYGVDLVEAIGEFNKFFQRYHPRRSLAMGNTALQALTGKVGIEEWRGSPFGTSWKGWIIPTLYPSNIQSKFDTTAKKEEFGSSKYTYGSGRMSIVLDMSKCFGWPSLEPPDMDIRTSYDPIEAIEWLESWAARTDQPLVFDIETKGRYIDIIGFAGSSKEAWVYPLSKKAWGFYHYNRFDAALRGILANHRKLVGQNAVFDSAMLAYSGYHVAPLWFDTRVAHSWVYPDLPSDLHYMVSVYTTHPYYKWMINTDRFFYNGLDCCLTYAVMDVLDKRILKMEGG